MDNDLGQIIPIPCELEGESCSSNIVEELALFWTWRNLRGYFPYNFEIALFFIEEATMEATMQEEVADAVSEIPGEITFLAKIVTRFACRKVAWRDIKMQNMGTKLKRGKRTFLHRRYYQHMSS
jgi:hypothetical protein